MLEEPGTMETVEPPVCEEVSFIGGLGSINGTCNLEVVSAIFVGVFELFVFTNDGNKACLILGSMDFVPRI